MRVVVTGGAGFIGSHVAQHAIAAGHEVLIVDDLSNGCLDNIPSGATFANVDIRDRDSLQQVFDAFKPQAVSHHAAQASVAISVRDPVLDAHVNVIGSINVLLAAHAHNARVVFASTGGALYGEVAEDELAKEDRNPQPLSPYACSKLAFEHYLRAKSSETGLCYTILRYGNVFGPRQDPHGEAGVVAIFLNRLLAGEPIYVNAKATKGDDGCIRDYVYIDDVVDMNLRAIDGRLDQKTVNVGTGIGTATRQLADVLIQTTQSRSECLDAEHRLGDLRRSVLDPSAMLAIKSTFVDLRQGLLATTAWFQEKHEQHEK